MGKDLLEIFINTAKLLAIFLVMVQLVPVLVWVERRASGFIQNRFGPNRVGPLGLVQLAADAVKHMFKEPFVPGKAVAAMYHGAPIMAIIPGALVFASIPLSVPIHWGEYVFAFQGYEFGIGIVMVLGLSSLGAYGILMAGWGSANKYSLMGALRASAQMISYELALGLSLVGIIMIYGTFSFTEMLAAQIGQPLQVNALGNEITVSWLPNWGIFMNPLGALIFFVAAFAEANRLPFDLPESEGELVAGFHTEYAGFSLLLFYIGEYGHMVASSALLVTFFFGGYSCPIPWLWDVTPAYVMQNWFAGLGANWASLATSLLFFAFLMSKILFFVLVFIWVRWTLPRFRYDHLMDLGWKTMLPWALFNTILTAVWLAFSWRH